MSSFDHDDQLSGKAYDGRLMRRILGYVAAYKGLAALGLGLTVLLAASMSVVPYLLGRAVDDGIMAGDLSALWTIGLLLLGIEALGFGLLFTQQYVLTLVSQRVMVDLRMALFDHVQRQALAFFGRHPVGRLVTRVMNDVAAIAELFSTGIVMALGDLLLIVFAAGFLFYLDWQLALVTFAVLPLVVLVTMVTKARIRLAFRDIRRLLARLNASLAENVQGVQVVQMFGRERQNLERFAGRNDEHLEAQLRSVHWNGVFSSTITILTMGTIAVLLGLGGAAALEGRLSLGVLVAFIAYAQRLFQPIRDLAEKYAIYQAAMASSERIFALLDTEPEVKDPERPADLPAPVRGAIAFEEVWFRYPKGGEPTRGPAAAGAAPPAERAFALRGISFQVAPGEQVAIVGHTGAGKSSLIQLLARFYDPTTGRVLLDGVDVRTVSQRALRRQIGLVLQDVFIFTGTVLENIRLGDPAITEERCIEAARAVGADEFIQRLPGGYEAHMRERGASLSLGQKQLLAFARVLARDPRVLVLDEATASVDPETERRLQKAVQVVTAGRTSLVIAHRLATIAGADRILVMHRGELREEGTLKDLLARRGLFYSLYRLQDPDAMRAAAEGGRGIA